MPSRPLRPDGTPLFANQTVLDYTGLTSEELQKEEHRSRVLDPEDVERLREPRREALERGKPFEVEQRGLGKDGKYRWFLVQANYAPARSQLGSSCPVLCQTHSRIREKEMIEVALAECRGKVAGPEGAAAKLGIPRSTLDSKIKLLKIKKHRGVAAVDFTSENTALPEVSSAVCRSKPFVSVPSRWRPGCTFVHAVAAMGGDFAGHRDYRDLGQTT